MSRPPPMNRQMDDVEEVYPEGHPQYMARRDIEKSPEDRPPQGNLNLKPHKCNYCGASFGRTQDLSNHVKTHNKDLKKLYKDSDLLIIDMPIVGTAYDIKENRAVKGYNIPEGYELHHIIKYEVSFKNPITNQLTTAIRMVVTKEDTE